MTPDQKSRLTTLSPVVFSSAIAEQAAMVKHNTSNKTFNDNAFFIAFSLLKQALSKYRKCTDGKELPARMCIVRRLMS